MSGEERYIKGYTSTPGGSAANTVVGLARLGHDVGYIGKLGNDPEGKFLLKSFKAENVNTTGVITSKKECSGIVIGFVDKTGERTLYVDPGANDTLCLNGINMDYIKETNFLHLTSFVGEKPFKAQKEVLQSLSDIKISFDPGSLYARKGIDSLKPILERSFIVLPNEDELRLLTREGFKDGAKTLINRGARIVAVKLGERGCYVTDGKDKFLIEPFKIKVVDTTGAGDAFCAGFLHGLILEKDLYTCGRIANFVASRKIEKIGARNGLPRISDLLKL